MKPKWALLVLMAFKATISIAGEVDWTQAPVERWVRAAYEIDLSNDTSRNRHYWYVTPPDHLYQSVVRAPQFSITPTDSIRDPDFGNMIHHWNFRSSQTFSLRMHWELKVRNVLNSIEISKVGSYDKLSSEYQLYTRSERLTSINPSVLRIKRQIAQKLAGESNPALIAKAVYFWVLDHMAYALLDKLDRDRGTDELVSHPFKHENLTYYKGDCGEYTLLYNAILRAFGIPARTVTGGWSIGSDQWHAWSEILIPNYGWIPVDTSAADVFVYDEGTDLNKLGDKRIGTFPNVKNADFYFGNLDPLRFVISIGNDISLSPVMAWDFSSYKLGWYYNKGKAGYIQIGIFDLLSAKKEYSIHFEDVEVGR